MEREKPLNKAENHNAPFNPALSEKFNRRLEGMQFERFEALKNIRAAREVVEIFERIYFSDKEPKDSRLSKAWALVHAAGWFRNKEGKWVKRKSHETRPKEFTQHGKETPLDPYDGHTHRATFDEDGNGGTDEAGSVPHRHSIFNFKVQPFYHYDPAKNQEYVSVHPGSVAFNEDEMTPEAKARMKKCMEDGGSKEDCLDKAKEFWEASRGVRAFGELGSIEMEIFRVGNHHGDEAFTEKDLLEIAANFHELSEELRPKLKITHRGGDGDEEKKTQENIAGLASYGDVIDVFARKGKDGLFHLYATVENVPKEVIEWIRDRRFPERSIEIYPEFTLGTNDDGKVYKNVLKAIALLGAEMPAVSGMAPIKLQECMECQGTECIVQSFEEKESRVRGKDYEALKILSEGMKFFSEQVKQ